MQFSTNVTTVRVIRFICRFICLCGANQVIVPVKALRLVTTCSRDISLRLNPLRRQGASRVLQTELNPRRYK